MDDTNQKVEDVALDAVDNESIEDTQSDSAIDSSNQAALLLSLEELIKNHIDSIAKLREELKAQREMFDDSFNNNPTYREHTEKVKEANKAKSSLKKQISSQPSVALLAEKIKDMRIDLAEKNQTLSDLLKDYSEQTGATSIETKDGKVLEIVSTLKLVRRNSK
jgi:predicted nuclease with TOPRIM domain